MKEGCGMGAIILFDGECNFCDKSVLFIIKRDKQAYFSFASLNSKIGKQLLKKYNVPKEVNSLIVIEDGHIFTKSSAVLQICRHLSDGWKFFTIFSFLPKRVRDSLYEFIAKNRYKWFGKNDSCILPTPDVRNRFL